MTTLNKCVFCRSPEMFICECEEAMAGCSTFWAECEACGARGPISEYKDGATISWNAILTPPEPTEWQRLIDELEIIHARANTAANTCDVTKAMLRDDLASVARHARLTIERAIRHSMPLHDGEKS